MNLRALAFALSTLAILIGLLLPDRTQAALDIPDVPLFMNSVGVKPNFIMTLDDSGSMQWAYVPDSVSSNSSTNRYKANYYNGMYYNPAIQYYPPPKYNGSLCTLDASNPSSCYPNVTYTSAPINGFDTSRGQANLLTDYRAVKVFSPSNTTQTYAGSPSGSSDRSYYAGTTGSVVDNKSYVCRVKFNKTNGDERVQVSNCSGGSSDIFSSSDEGETLNLACNSSDGCSMSADDKDMYLQWHDGNGDPQPYTIDHYGQSDKVRVGQQIWDADLTVNNIRVEWQRVTTGSVSYPGYYYLFYTQAGVSKPTDCTSTTSSQKTDDDCYVRRFVGNSDDIYKNPDGSSASYAQKWQNFANWYSYYRTRNLALVSGTMASVTGLDDNVRVAWQALNTCKTFTYSSTSCRGWDYPSTGVDNRIRALGATLSNGKTHRQELYEWLARFPANSGTPLRTAAQRAGQYCDASVTALGPLSPWAQQPPTDAGTYHACRRSIQLLMTDGIWNSDSVSYGNATNASVTLPGTAKMPSGASTWSPGRPYTDGNSNDLADIAFYYWKKDLATGLDDKLTELFTDRSGTATEQWLNPKNDPAVWQHLTTYSISLGLSSALSNPAWGGDTYSGDYNSIVSGSKSWPSTGENSSGNAYDLWHAAIAGRGLFFSAESANELKNAFKSVINTVASVASAGGGAGLGSNSTKIATGSAVYLATFSGDWTGQFQAIPIQSDGSLGSTIWEAGQRIPYAEDRHIYTFNSGSAESFSSCTDAMGTALNKNKEGVTDNLCARRLSWLRGFLKVSNATWSSTTGKATFTVNEHGFSTGDEVEITGVTPSGYNGVRYITKVNDDSFTMDIASDPGAFETTTTGNARYAAFRVRSATVLGDIMNSDPIYTHKEDFGYGAASSAVTGKTDYAAYVSNKSPKTPIVYVGANDGMLHAFNAETAGSNAGKELFAYVPSAVYGNLSKLTSPLYSHQFYVDGSPTISDVYLSGWKTYLVGGLGKGGKSVYALDISQASDFNSAEFNPATYSASSLVKWEYSHSDLGYTFSQPQIAPITPSQWAAVFGNGYSSSTSGLDMAYLFVVDMSNGTLIAKIGAGTATSNGLATPYLHDSNGDKVIDVAYAGDLKGNLWKFVNTNGNWTLGNGGYPLFTATVSGNPQPITSQPRVLPHPTSGGSMVYFGTGSYLINADLTNTHVQTLYGVWDSGTAGTLTRSDLLGQTVTTVTTGSGDYRTISNTDIDWVSKKGWYIDLPATTGVPTERVVSPPAAKKFSTLDSRVIFTTMTPTPDPCDRGGLGWLVEVDARNGGNLVAPVFDTNNDGIVDAGDTNYAGMRLPDTIGVTKTPLWLEGGESNDGHAFKFFTGSKGTTITIKQTSDPEPPTSGAVPIRVYWRQIM